MPYDFGEEAELTNQQLAGELAKISPLTEEEINKLLPKKVEKEQFSQLIQVVNSSASRNNKLASLEANFAAVGGVMLKLLMKYLKPI